MVARYAGSITDPKIDVTAAHRHRIGTLAVPVWNATSMPTRPSAEKVSPKIMRRRRSKRSASTPPSGPSSSPGRNAAIVTKATDADSPVCW